MKCLSPDINLSESSVVVRGGSSGLLTFACLAGSAALVAIMLANRRASLRTISRRLRKLETLRQQGIITADESQARRQQILQEI